MRFSLEYLHEAVLFCFVFCCASQSCLIYLGFLLRYMKNNSGISGKVFRMLFPLKLICFPKLDIRIPVWCKFYVKDMFCMYVIHFKFLAKFPAFPVQGSIELMW